MRIQTISSLSLTEHWDGVKTHTVAKRQGHLDGACGPYALMNALMLSGVLTEKQVSKLWDAPADGRTVLGRWSRSTEALIPNGTEIENLMELLRGVQQQVKRIPALEVAQIELSGRKEGKLLGGLCAIQEWIDLHDQPVLATLGWDKYSAHWVVVVGSQYHERNGKYGLSNLLAVDSEEESSCTQAWNAVLGLGDIGAKRLRYTSPSRHESTPCDLLSAFGILTV